MTQLKRLVSCDIDNPVTARPATSNRRRRWRYAGALGRLPAMLAAACTLIAPVSAIAQTSCGSVMLKLKHLTALLLLIALAPAPAWAMHSLSAPTTGFTARTGGFVGPTVNVGQALEFLFPLGTGPTGIGGGASGNCRRPGAAIVSTVVQQVQLSSSFDEIRWRWTAPASVAGRTCTFFVVNVRHGEELRIDFDIIVRPEDNTVPAFNSNASIPDQIYLVTGAITGLTLPEATGDGALTYSITPELPTGLTLTGNVLTGTPAADTAQALTAYTYRASDSDSNTADTDTGTLTFTIEILDGRVTPMFISTASIPAQTYNVGTDIGAVTLPQGFNTGGGALVYSITPTLPAGLTLTGRILTGTPAANTAQTATDYTYRVDDSDGSSDDFSTLPFTITIPADVPDNVAAYNETVNEGVLIPGLASVVTPPAGVEPAPIYTYTITDRGTLPESFANSLVPETGVFSRRFSCAELSTGQTVYSFEWELRNSDGDLVVTGAQTGIITLGDDPDCGPTATLIGTLTEADLFATPAPTVTVELDTTEYVDPLDTSHFTVTQNTPGVITISGVTRTRDTAATLTLAYNNVDITFTNTIRINVLAAGHTGSDNLSTNRLDITPRPGVNVCDRTPVVSVAIVDASADPDCTAVNDLATITSLSISGGITALQSGDFADLTGLTMLSLNNNPLTTLPADIFAGLMALARLDLSGNSLSSLNPATFAGLTMLDTLSLNNNQFEALPPTVFDQLAMLNTIRLNGNPFTPATGLPAGIFDEIIGTIGASGFVVDDTVRAGHFVCSRADADAIVATIAGVDDCLRITTDQRGTFVQADADLSALTISAGILVPDFNPATTTYTVAVENSVSSVTITPTARQDGIITVDGATVTSGSASTALALTAGTPLVVDIEVTAPAPGTATVTYTVTVTRQTAGTTAMLTGPLTGPLTEADLFAATAPTVTMTLAGTEFVGSAALGTDDFSLSDNVPGTVSITGVTRDSDTVATLTLAYDNVDITANGALIMTLLASGHTGSDNLATDSLAITASAGTNICGRTAEVRDRLLVVLTPPDCTAVAGLAGITQLALNFRASNPLRDITALQPGDFAGLTGMTGLSLSGNSLTTLPATIFDGLDNLTRITLNGNDLTTLPATIFDGVDALQTLSLYENPTLTAGTGLPAGIFDEVLNTLGAVLDFTSETQAIDITGLVVDADARDAHFVCSRDDADAIVTATSGVDDCLRITTTQLNAITDADASLSALTFSAGELRPTFDSAVTEYDVAVDEAMVTITPTANEDAATITVDGATVASGFASGPITLTTGAAVPVTIVVTAGDDSTQRTYTVMVTRGGPEATLAGPLTEVNLFGTPAPTVTVTLDGAEFVIAANLSGDDFTLMDTLAGTVSVSDVDRTSATVATLTLEYTGEDITADGALSITVRPSAYPGSGALITNTIPVTASAGANVCGRTAQVRDEIVRRSSVTECTGITDLATIAGTLDLNSAGISTLQPGDFAGLTSLTFLRLSRNPLLQALPPTIFAGLTSLDDLTLGLSGLEALPPTIFAGLTELRQLNLDGNSLSTLPAGVFAGLTSLQNLRLDGNDLEALPATIFNDLDMLLGLFLHENLFTADTGLPAGIFDDVLDTLGPIVTTAPSSAAEQVIAIDQRVRDAHFVCSRDDADVIVAITAGVDNCLRITAAQLTAFPMIDTSLSALTISDGGLVPTFNPATLDYDVAVLTAVESVTVTPTANQSGATITVASATVASGNPSGPITLTEGTPLDIDIVVTAPDGMTASTSTVTVTRAAAGTTATLAGTLTEANLFAGTAMVTMTLAGTEFVGSAALGTDDFSLSANVPGTVRITRITSTTATATTVATLTLEYDDEDITANGALIMTLLASGHTGSGNLATNSLPITASTAGANVCGRTAQVVTEIVAESSATECTSITDLATIGRLSLASMNLAMLQNGDFDGLTGLNDLNFGINQLTALPAGIFDDLAALTILNLSENQLEELPPGIFDELDALTTLRLEVNNFTPGTGLPAGIFDEILDTVMAIPMSSGSLFSADDTVRAAHFVCSRDDADAIVTATTGVTDCLRINTMQLNAFTDADASLSALTLSAGELRPTFDPAVFTYNVAVDEATVTITPTANEDAATITVNAATVASGTASGPITLTTGAAVPVTIVVTGGDGSAERTYTIMVTRGAPAATLAGTLTEANLFGTPAPTVTVTLERSVYAANLSGDDFTLMDTVGGTVSVSDVARTSTVATLRLAYDNVDITADGGLSITVRASAHTGSGALLTNTLPVTASAGANVCGRTAQVRDEIVRVSSATECTSITDLATIDTLEFNDPAPGDAITTLQSGDFAGLTGLENLRFLRNSLTTLPPDIFAGLSALVELNLFNNDLDDTLPVGVFAGLTSVQSLFINSNAFTSLPAGIFDGLDELVNLALHTNPSFTPGTGLPAGIFDDVLNTLVLIPAMLGSEGLSVDTIGRAAHFVCSLDDADAIVAFTSGVDDCLRINSTQLAAFFAADTRLSALTISSGGMLIPDFAPGVTTYTVGLLNSVESITVTPTANQPTAMITVGGVAVNNGTPSAPITLDVGTAMAIEIIVTSPGRATTETVTVTATREALAAELAGAVTEANLFAATAPTVTVTLTGADYVEAGELMPDDFTVTDTTDGTVSITEVARTSNRIATLTLGYDDMDITAAGTLLVTVLESGHSASGDLATETIDITASTGDNVCGRTAQVVTGIVGESAATECTSIEDLADITSLTLTNRGLTALRSGDFAGMMGLAALNLSNNLIATIDAGTFADLSALQNLNLGGSTGNRLTALDAEVFDDLSALTNLDLRNNDLAALPADIFDGLNALDNLDLDGNSFTPATGLPAGIFDDIIDTLRTVSSGTLNVDDTARAAHFVCSRDDFAAITAAAGATDCLLVSSAFLDADATLSALTVSPGVLTLAFDPATLAYNVAVPINVTRVTITPTATQDGATITVEGTPVASGGSIAYPPLSGIVVLSEDTPTDIEIVVTAPDGMTEETYTLTATRQGSDRVQLTGPITEANLFAGTAVATMTLPNTTEFEPGVATTDFRISDTVDGAISIAGVALVDGSSTTTATIMLTHSGEDITADGTFSIDLLDSGHTGSGDLAADTLPITTNPGDYVCGRTAAVRDAITTASAGANCANITDLADITALDLSNQGITGLQDGDLDGLDALVTLALAGNPFTADTLPAGTAGGLPAGIFDDVLDTLGDVGTAFTVDNIGRQAHFICSRADASAIVSVTGVTDCLRITEAQLAAFPPIDTSLRALTLSTGDLMPAFDPAITAYNVGVAASTSTVTVTVTPTANQSDATITVNGDDVDSGSASDPVTLVAGTAVPITIQVTATGGTTKDYVVMVTRGGASAVLLGDLGEQGLFSSAASRRTAVTLARTEFVAATELGPDDFMVTETIDGTVSVASVTRTNATAVTLTMEYTGTDITANGVFSITVLASGHTGSGDLITNTQPITASTGVNVCRRTPAVRDALTGSGGDCTSITDLATRTQLTIQSRGVTSLQSGDFAGLSALRTLLISGNPITTLPADIFAGLSALEDVNLANNNLDTLDANVFAGLSSVDDLFLSNNNFESLPAGIFDGLGALEDLALGGNPWTPGTGLPAGIFDDVLNTVGPVALGGTAGLGVDAVGRAAHFVCSLPVADLIVAATADVDSCLRITVAQLAAFAMVDTSLSALTISSGDMLMPAFSPATTTYTVGVLNSVESITVTPTANQSTAMITVQGAPVANGSASAPIPLMTVGAEVAIEIIVTAPDGMTMQTVTVTATREGAPAAVLAGTVTEANLFAATAPTVTVTLTGTDYVAAGELMPDDFTVTDTLMDGTVSITEVARTSNRIATLTLGYDRVDIPDAGGMLSVTVLAAGHSASASGDLDAGMIDITASPGTNVCGRTAQVVTAILALSTPGSECTNAVDLTTITDLRLGAQGIAELRNGDFAGLSGLTILTLDNNRLETLPADIFAGLTELVGLNLSINRFTTLPADIFDGLTELRTMSLAGTSLGGVIMGTLETLPADIFDGTALVGLSLIDNPFTPETGLPAGIFDDILDTLGPFGTSVNDEFGIDNRVRDAHFICIRDDADAIVAFTSGVDDCLRISTADLTAFFASDATLSALTISDGVLSPAFDLATVAYTVAVQNSVASVTVTPTASQSMATITVNDTAVNSGAASTAITLPEDTTTAILIAVGAPNGSSTTTYTINVTHPAATDASAALTGPLTLTEADLFAATTPTVMVTLTGTGYVDSADLMPDDFAVTDTIDGTVSIAAGVERTSTTVATLSLSYDAVDVSDDGFLTVAVRASGHTGAGNLSAGRLDITASTGTNVCGRTAAVRDAIVGLSAATECTSVTDLATIAGALDLSGAGITALQPGDFAGLAALTVLNLSGNMLATLPAGVFDDLAALTVLDLSGNSLGALDAAQFGSLMALQTLDLSGNTLGTLDAAQFGGLAALQTLDLSGNTLSALDAAQFGGLAALQTLDLSGNRLRALDAGAFQGLTALATLSLAGNSFTAGSGLPSGVFDDVLDTLLTIGAGPTGLIVDDNVRAAHFVCSLPEVGLIVAGTSGDCLRVTAAQLAAFAMQDSSLSALTLSDGALVPAFAPTILSYSVGVAGDVTMVTVTPTANQAAATITVGGAPVNSGEASDPITLTAGTIDIVVTAADGAATTTYAVTVTPGAATATLAGTVNEAALFATPTVTVTLARSAYVDAADLTMADFTLTDSIAGTVSITGVERTSTTVATLTLAYDDVDITADGELFLTVLATGHTGSVDLVSPSLRIAQSTGVNVCGRTAEVRDRIVGASSASECTSITDLATIQTGSITGIFSLSDRGITSLQDGDFAGMTGMRNLRLEQNSLTTLPAGIFAGLSGLEVIVITDNNLETLPPNVFAGLSALTALGLAGNNLASLPANVFAGLSSLTFLSLDGNNLASLPADIFDGLGLVNFTLFGNPFTADTGLPAGIFDDVIGTLDPITAVDPSTSNTRGFIVDDTTRAAHFVCSRADFAAITTDAGATDCLLVTSAQLTAFIQADTGLSALTISDGALSPAFDPATATYTVAVLNTVDEVTVTPTVRQSGATIAVQTVAVTSGSASTALPLVEDTPLAINIVVTAPDGSTMGTYTVTVSRPAATDASAALSGTLTEAILFAATATATVTLASTEYVSGLSEADFTVTDTIDGTVSVTGVTRTSDTVADLVLSYDAVDVSANGFLTVTVLAAGHTGDVDLAAGSLAITASAGANVCGRTAEVVAAIMTVSTAADCTDIPNLASITELDLSGVVTTLQSGDFAGMTGLTSLNLSGDLFIEANRLRALPADIFAGLTALQTLNLTSNELDALDADQFAGLTMLTTLDLQSNNIDTLDADQFTGLTALTSLNLQNNPLGELDAGQFAGLTALQRLALRSTQLNELPPTIFAGLSELEILDLARNGLAALNPNQFAGLTELTDLFLNRNALTSLPANIFAGLSALEILQLSNNPLGELDAGQFTGLTMLDLLNLGSNQFTTLPAGLFDGLEALSTLSLQFNMFTPGTGLPAGIFDDVLDTLGGIGIAFEVDDTVRDAHFVCSRDDANAVVAATDDVDDCLRIISSELTDFVDTDADLTELTISVGDLVPAFDPAIFDYTVAVANDVAMVTVTPTVRQTSATITVNNVAVDSGAASMPIMLMLNTAEDVPVVVTATDGITVRTYTIMVTRGGAAATLAGTVNEAALFATPTVTVTLERSEYVDAADLTMADFTLTDSIAGTVSITGVERTSTTVATLTLEYDNVDITADGELFLTVLAAGHTGSIPLVSRSLRIAQSAGTNVCGRTAEVVAGIVAASAATECTSITDLATIMELNFNQPDPKVPGGGITTLQSGDFAGLSGLTDLLFLRNSLTTLPPDIFAGLSSLEELNLFNNDLDDTLPVGVFAGLTSVESLFINRNNFASLPVGIFDGLNELENLALHNNPFTPGTGLPAGIFDDVLDTLLVATTIGSDGLSVDATGRAAHFVCSLDDADADAVVAATMDVDNCLHITEAQLTTFFATDTRLSALTISAGVLRPDFDPATLEYDVTVLDTVGEVTVTPTVSQSGATVTVQTVAVDSGSASETITLTATPMNIDIVVTAPDGTTGTYTLTVSRPAMGGATAMLEGTVTEANLFAGTAMVTVTLMDTQYDSGVGAADFRLSDDVAGGTVSLRRDNFTLNSATTATLTLLYSGEDITAGGTLMMTLLASGHTGTAPLATNGLEIDASDGANICNRTAEVQAAILVASTATECTSITDLAMITELDLDGDGITALQSGDFADLTGLTSLLLANNDLSALPADIFDGLALVNLALLGNSFTAGGLPAGVFDPVLNTLATIATSGASGFVVDDTVRDAHFVCSRSDADDIVTATTGVTDCLRITAAQFDAVVGNVMLSALTISEGTLDPAFDPAVTVYTVTVANSTASVTVTPTAASSISTITVNGMSVVSGSASAAIALAAGASLNIVIVVTADDDTTGAYRVAVTRLPADEATATLVASMPLTEANVDGATVTVTLANTEYEDPLAMNNFMLTDTVAAGTVSLSGVDRTSATVATLTLAYTGAAFSGDGTLLVTVLDTGHTGTGDLPAGSVPITATAPAPAPTVTEIAITSTGPYALDEEIDVTVTFSENVTVVGMPQIALMVDTNARQAIFASGSGNANLVFTYTVVAGETDANGVSINADALTLNGGTIRNSAGDDAVLTHTITVTAVPANAVDTTAPSFSSAAVDVNVLVLTYEEDLDTSSTPANDAYTIGLSSGTPPTVSGVTISGATVTLALSAPVGNGLTATVSYTPGSTPLRDIAGNNAVGLTDASVTNNTSSDPAASLTAPTPLTEANVDGASVTVTLVNTGYEDPLEVVGDFTLTDTVAGTVSLSSVTRTSTTAATLTLAYSGEAFSGSGTLSVTVLDAGHTGAGDLTTNTVDITATPAGPDLMPTFGIATISNQTYIEGTTITAVILPTATSGDAPLAYTLTPVLPNGLSFNTATRMLSGTPTAMQAAVTYTYTVTDSDRDTDTLTFTITVSPAGPVTPVTPVTPGPTPEQTAVLHDEIAPQALQTVAGSVVASVGARIETTVQGVSTGGVRLDGQGMEGDGAAILRGFLDKVPEYTRSIKEGDLNWKRMLANSSFSLNAAGDGSAGGGLGVWGSGHYMEFNGDDNDLDWDGDSFSFQIGADTRLRPDLLTGIAVSWSEGDVEYSLGDGADAERGDYVLTLTGIHPYLGWSSGDGRMSLWASLGYADGKIEIEPDEGVDREHDTTVVSVAGGFTRSLTDFLRIKGDFSGLEADIDEADEVLNDSDFSTESQRLRLLLEGRHQQRLPGGGTLSQSAEVGYRVDEGDSDADTDGTEVGGSVDYHNPATGFSVSGKIRALVGNSDYQEWGVSGLIRLESDAQGLSFTLEPGYGDTAGSAGELWQRKTPYLETERQSYGARMKMHLGYGLHGGIMPYTELTSGEALRSFRMGVKWQLGKALDLNLFGEQYEADESDNSLQLEGKLEF